MNARRRHRRVRHGISLAEKRRVLLGLDDGAIRALQGSGRRDDFEAASVATGLEPDAIRRLVADPRSLEDVRLDPNVVRRAQLEQIPGLGRHDLDTILGGRPFFSWEELEAAAPLSPLTLRELFAIEPLYFDDPTTGRAVTFEPVLGRYLVPTPEFESDPAPAAGYAEIFRASPRTGWRLVGAMDYEGAQRPHDLKRELGGRVHPVLRDVDGLERYLLPGAIDVWFRREVATPRRMEILREAGLDVVAAVLSVGLYRTVLPPDPSRPGLVHAVFRTIRDLAVRPEVRLAEPDEIGFEDADPDPDHEAGEDDFEAADRYWNEEVIGLVGAHAITPGSPDVTVVVIDSGCRMDHEALAPGFRPDWPSLDLSFDLGEPTEAASPDEIDVAHGTMVAGVVRRMAPGCRILPLKIPGQPGGPATPGYGLRAAAILAALEYVQPGQRAVLNLSWKTNGEHLAIREALREAAARGCVVVTSAGNYPRGAQQRPDELHFPSAHAYRDPANPALLSVAAVGPGDVRASYSFFGSQSVSVAAPGGEAATVGSGVYTTTTSASVGAGHAYAVGTSFAAPHVAGLAALLLSARPDLSAEQVVATIKETAADVLAANPGSAGQLGAGRIQCLAALERVAGPLPLHTIIVTAGDHGAVVPTGPVVVPSGASRRFEFVADPGYAVDRVLVDGAPVGAAVAHTLTNVTRSMTLAVTFAEASTPTGPVDINTATAATLETLPHIGAWLAGHIVAVRTADGPYGTIWDLERAGMSAWAIGQIAARITT